MLEPYDSRHRLVELLLGAGEGEGTGEGKGKRKTGAIAAEWPRLSMDVAPSGWSKEALTVAAALNSLRHALMCGLLNPTTLLLQGSGSGTSKSAAEVGERDARKMAGNILVAAAITYIEAGRDQAAMMGAIGSAFVPPTSAPMVDVVSQEGTKRLHNFLQFETTGGGCGPLDKPRARHPPFNEQSGCCEYEVDTEPYHGRDGGGSEGSFEVAFKAHTAAIFGSGVLFSAAACMRNINCSGGKPRQKTHFDAHAQKGFEEAPMVSAVSALPTRVNAPAIPAATPVATPVLGPLLTAKFQLTADPQLYNLLREGAELTGVATKDLLARTAAAALMVVGVPDGGTAERTTADATGITTWFCWLAGLSAPTGDIPTTLVMQRGVGDEGALGLPCGLGTGTATEYHIMPCSTLFFSDGHAGGVQPAPKGGVPPARARAHTYGRYIGDVCRWFGLTRAGDLMHEAQGSGDAVVDDFSDRYASDTPVVAVKFARVPGSDKMQARKARLTTINAQPVVARRSGEGIRMTRKSGASLVLSTEEVLALAALVENDKALKQQLDERTKAAGPNKRKR